MSKIISDILVGEDGDVLIPDRIYRRSFSYIPSEVVEWNPLPDGSTPAGSYVRLLGLPPIQEVMTTGDDDMNLLTIDGRFLSINEDDPQVMSLELDTPPLKRITATIDDTMAVVGVNDTLYWFNEDEDEDEDYRPEILGSMKIRGFAYGREVSGTSANNANYNMMIVLTDKELIYDTSNNIMEGKYHSVTIDQGGKLIGRLLIYPDGRILKYSKSRDKIEFEEFFVDDYQVVDAIADSSDDLYTLDNKGIIRSHILDYVRIIETSFKPTRLLLHDDWGIMVEDDGGNIYQLPSLRPINYPIVLINPDKISQGRMLKPARRTSLLHSNKVPL